MRPLEVQPCASGKVCTRCKKWKPADEFGRRNDRKCGLRSWCKKCTTEADALRFVETPRREPNKSPMQDNPMQHMTLQEQLDCRRLARWARNIEPNPRFGVAMIGGGYV